MINSEVVIAPFIVSNLNLCVVILLHGDQILDPSGSFCQLASVRRWWDCYEDENYLMIDISFEKLLATRQECL